jgi:hypothetical protein
MAKQSVKSKRIDNLILYRRFIELQIYLGYDIVPYLFVPYSKIKWDRVKDLVEKMEKDYEGGY